MKTLILNGSPRANGDTVSLIKELTKKLPGEYKIVNAYHCDVSPCVDCRYCWELPGCAIADEMSRYDTPVHVEKCETLELAVQRSFALTKPGKSCLLSPAAASYNRYKNFEEKGNAFKKLVADYDG